MRVLNSTIRRDSEDYRRNQTHYEGLLADLRKHLALVRAGGALTMLVLGTFLITAWRRDRRARVNG